jgi:hypothetical protein
MSKSPPPYILSKRPVHERISFLVSLTVPSVPLCPPRLYFPLSSRYFKGSTKLLPHTITKAYKKIYWTTSEGCRLCVQPNPNLRIAPAPLPLTVATLLNLFFTNANCITDIFFLVLMNKCWNCSTKTAKRNSFLEYSERHKIFPTRTVRATPRRYPNFDVVVRLVWSHDPKSYAGGSVCHWKGLPCQTRQGWWPRQKWITWSSWLGVWRGANPTQ